MLFLQIHLPSAVNGIIQFLFKEIQTDTGNEAKDQSVTFWPNMDNMESDHMTLMSGDMESSVATVIIGVLIFLLGGLLIVKQVFHSD